MAIPIESTRARWHRPSLAETDASDHASAACYRRPEDIGVVPMVVAELEFGDVQRQILPADLVIAAHDPALDEGPEAFDCLSVNRANDVIAVAFADHFVREGTVKKSV